MSAQTIDPLALAREVLEHSDAPLTPQCGGILARALLAADAERRRMREALNDADATIDRYKREVQRHASSDEAVRRVAAALRARDRGTQRGLQWAYDAAKALDAALSPSASAASGEGEAKEGAAAPEEPR